jgi:hypothetical protein
MYCRGFVARSTRGNGFKMIPLRSGFLRRLIAAALTVPSLWNVALSGQPSTATVVALDPGVTAGVGAPLEFVEYEAKNGATNDRIVGPDRTFATLASEASGRRAVLLGGHGDYVEFTLSAPANALTVRYAVPDGPDGKPVDARLGVYAQNRRIGELAVIAIDLVDLETVPAPLSRPSRSLSVVDFGADPYGVNLHHGISGVIVEESFFRNNGDDGIASWAEELANHDIIIRHNTVVAPILANGAAIYGGHDIAATDNLIADTLTEGGGLHLGNRFGAVPLSGKISLKGNIVVRGLNSSSAQGC